MKGSFRIVILLLALVAVPFAIAQDTGEDETSLPLTPEAPEPVNSEIISGEDVEVICDGSLESLGYEPVAFGLAGARDAPSGIHVLEWVGDTVRIVTIPVLSMEAGRLGGAVEATTLATVPSDGEAVYLFMPFSDTQAIQVIVANCDNAIFYDPFFSNVVDYPSD